MRFAILPLVALISMTALPLQAGASGLSPFPQVGDSLPCLGFEPLSGGPILDRSALRGKTVVIDFWATWCPPCVEAFPKLNRLHQQFADEDVLFFSVTYEPERFVRRFLQEHPLESAVGIDSSFETFRCFQAWGIPVVFLFDRTGALAAAIHPDRLTAEMIATVQRGEVPEVEQAEPWPDPAGAEKYFREHRQKLLAEERSP